MRVYVSRPLEDFYIPEPMSGCWLWIGGGIQYGNYRNRPAHRVVYEQIRGPIPKGLHLDHLCRVTCCVNPAHLEPVTPRENLMRGFSIQKKNAVKTVCANGHQFASENTRYSGGRRTCRACDRARNANGDRHKHPRQGRAA